MKASALTDKAAALDAIVTVDDILVHHAKSRPERNAFYFEGEALSWDGLDRRANQIANGLIAIGTPHQGRIGYIGKNHLSYFETLAGGARSGRVLCPINWRLSVYEIASLLDDFDVEFLVIDAFLIDHLPYLRKKLFKMRQIVVNEGEIEGYESFTAWRDKQSSSAPDVTVTPDDIVLQMHTSGTTGVPKGVMHPHRVYLSQARMSLSGELGSWGGDDVVVVPLPIFHVGGTGFASYGYCLGSETVISREASPSFVIECLKARPATRLGLVPAVMQMMLDSPDFSSDLVRNLTCLNFGGAPITVELLKRTFEGFNCDLSQQFGMTETASIVSVANYPFLGLAEPKVRMIGLSSPLKSGGKNGVSGHLGLQGRALDRWQEDLAEVDKA